MQEMKVPYSKYQRVGVFVDVQNMFYSAKHIRDAKLNFSKLMEKAVRGRQLIRAICYVIENKDIDQSSFIEMLKSNGYEIKVKELRTRADGSAKGDWDMGIAIDAISLAEKLDIAVLVSGDGDFADMVYHLQSKGVFVEAYSFPESTNTDLINAVDMHVPITTELLLLPNKSKGKRAKTDTVRRQKSAGNDSKKPGPSRDNKNNNNDTNKSTKEHKPPTQSESKTETKNGGFFKRILS